MTNTFNFRARAITIISLTFFCLVFFSVVYGQAGTGLVPCTGADLPGGTECEIGHVLILVSKILNWIFNISFSIAALLYAYAGYLYLTHAGKEAQLFRARSVFTSTTIGLIIVLLAFFSVETLMEKLGVKPAFYSKIIDFK